MFKNFCFYLDVPVPQQLSIGFNKFVDNTIKLTPVRTIYHGLCYKIQFSNSFPDFPEALTLIVLENTSGRDELKKINMLIASNNTWQGIIINNWPYNKAPPLIEQKFIPNVMKMAYVHLEENVWKKRTGNENFKKCMENKVDNKCVSIFDITSNEAKNQ